jgi:hypothetical protein
MTLRMRVLPRFPATIYATNGLTVERPAGTPNLIVKPSFGDLVQIPNVGDGDNVFFMAWDKVLGLYRIMSFNDLFAGVADLGFMEESVYDPQGKHADAFARANHTGTQAISTVTNLQTSLDAKADAAATTAALAAKLALAGGVMTGPIENAIFAASGANTKRAHFDLTAVTAGQDRVIRVPNFDTSTSIWEPIGVYDFTGLGTAGQLVQNLGAYRDLHFRIDFTGSGSNGMAMQFSDNNGSSFVTSATYTRGEVVYSQLPSNTVAGGAASDTAVVFGTVAPAVGSSLVWRGELVKFNKATSKLLDGSWHTNGGASNGNVTVKLGYFLSMLNTFNALKFYATSGTVDGRFVLEGIRG